LPEYYSREERKLAMQKSKRRKTNMILNTLIVIVIALICIVAYSIFFAGSDNSKPANDQKKAATTNAASAHKQTSSTDSSKKKTAEKSDKKQSTRKVVKSSEPNVKEVITDSSWKPVGTEQTGGHVYSSSSSSIDWKEKLKALSYATGIPEDNMTVWFLEHGATTDEAIGTVSAKNSPTTYRVYLTWVDGKGWKPVKIYELIENDKK